MASAKGPFKKGQPSIKHSCNVAESKRKLSKISDHEHVEYPYASQRHNRSRGGSSKLSQMLSRDALISAVDLMWDRPDSVSTNLISSLKEANLVDSNREEVTKFKAKAKSQLVRVSEKMCYNQNCMQSFFSCAKQNGFPLEARWMEGVAPTITRFHKGDTEVEKKESCTSGNANSCAEDGHSTPIVSRSPLLESITESSRSMDANSLFMLYKDRCANNRGVNVISSKCSSRDCPSKLSSCSGDNKRKDSLSMVEGGRKDQENEVCSSSTETPAYAFAKHRHAFAGALAGVSVSLCLHPLDTVKTMIQSCSLQEKSLCSTGRSIICERGRTIYLRLSYHCVLLLKSQYVCRCFWTLSGDC